jgi:ribose transport system permease protein
MTNALEAETTRARGNSPAGVALERASFGEAMRRRTQGSTFPILVALIAVIVAMSFLSDRFMTYNNFANILAQSAVVGIAAVGATFVIITAGIDLSVGSAVALAGMSAGLLMNAGGNAAVGIGVAMLVCIVIGAFNGASVAWLRLAPFIVTLAALGMGRGLTLQISGGQSAYNFPDAFNWLGSGVIGPVPVSALVMVVVFVLGHVLLTKTTFGHRVIAVGGNREAARLSGIRDQRTLFQVYIVAGVCAGIAAIILAGRLGTATPTAGEGLELQVIAGVVIGGTSLFGGRGSLLGTFIGVLLIGIINNGLTLLNVSPFLVQFVQGALIFIAVLLDRVNERRLRRRSA